MASIAIPTRALPSLRSGSRPSTACSPGQLLVTRGSSEAIDVVVRAFCRAGQDNILICPPTFGMYEVYARIQGAGVQQVPLDRATGYSLPVDAILREWLPATKLVFVCSPNNPTGNRFPDADVDRLCAGLAGRGVVILDAAYQEFAGEDPMHELLASHDNLVVLRTLSKALSLAGVRCGALIGRSDLVELLGRVLPPYCFPTTSQDAVLRLLTPEAQQELARRRGLILAERQRLMAALPGIPGHRPRVAQRRELHSRGVTATRRRWSRGPGRPASCSGTSAGIRCCLAASGSRSAPRKRTTSSWMR